MINNPDQPIFSKRNPAEKIQLRLLVDEIVDQTRVIDLHTHLFAPEFDAMNLSGIDELLTYHYLVAETFRSSKIDYERFWELGKRGQADLVWKTLFIENTPLSEACRGVITVLNSLGLDPNAEDLTEAREFFNSRSMPEHINEVFALAGVSDVVMTNDPFDDREAEVWKA